MSLSDFAQYDDNTTHRLPANWTGQIIARPTEFDAFLEICTNQVRRAVIVLDDCGGQFDSKLSNTQVEFVYSTKNNEYNVLYQMHTLNQPGPEFFKAVKKIVLKETWDNKIPEKVLAADIVKYLMADLKAENRERVKAAIAQNLHPQLLPTEQKWATRWIDYTTEQVIWETLTGELIQARFDEIMDAINNF
jgi:hypothetical protein